MLQYQQSNYSMSINRHADGKSKQHDAHACGNDIKPFNASRETPPEAAGNDSSFAVPAHKRGILRESES